SAIVQTLKNGEKMPWAIGEIAYSIKLADISEHGNSCLELMRLDKEIVHAECDPGRSIQKFLLVSKNNNRVFSLQNKGHPGCVDVESGILKYGVCSGKDNQQFNLIHQDQRGIQLQVKSSGLCVQYINKVEMVQCNPSDTKQRFKLEYRSETLSKSLGYCSDCYHLPNSLSDKDQPYYVVPEKVYDPKSGLLVPVLGFYYSFDGKIMLKTFSASASSICPEGFNNIQAPGTDGITFEKIKVSQPLENAADMASGAIEQGKNYYFKKTQMVLWSLAQGALNQDKLHKGLSSEFKEDFKPTINKALGKLPDLKNLFGLKPKSSVGDGSAIDANTSVKDLANLICPTPGHSVSPIVSPEKEIDPSCEQEDSTTDSEDKGNSDAQMLAFIKYMQKYPDQLGKTLAGLINHTIPLCEGFNPTQGSICKEATPAEHPDPEEVEVGNDRGQYNKTEDSDSNAQRQKFRYKYDYLDNGKNKTKEGYSDSISLDDIPNKAENVSFTGTLVIKKAGDYTFYVHADRDTHLYINKKPVLYDNVYDKEEKDKIWRLEAGEHEVEVKYDNPDRNGKTLEVKIKGPDTGQKKVVLRYNYNAGFALDFRLLSFRYFIGNNMEDYVRGYLMSRWWLRNLSDKSLPEFHTLTFDSKTIPFWKPSRVKNDEIKDCIGMVVDTQLASTLGIRFDKNGTQKTIYWDNRFTIALIGKPIEWHAWGPNEALELKIRPSFSAGIVSLLSKNDAPISNKIWYVPGFSLALRHIMTHGNYLDPENPNSFLLSLWNTAAIVVELWGSTRLTTSTEGGITNEETQSAYTVSDLRLTPLEYKRVRGSTLPHAPTAQRILSIEFLGIIPKYIWKIWGGVALDLNATGVGG
ncbi:MAG: PA14 domain-containing protein, partial [Gammaproteobacteria bacterium]|nr:PA14 domain-containing protein [Gammaproteobacteria bacterium]